MIRNHPLFGERVQEVSACLKVINRRVDQTFRLSRKALLVYNLQAYNTESTGHLAV